MKYEDIINMKYIKSDNRKHLSTEKRAAQFAPFAALSGFSDEISESEKININHFEYNEELIKEIDSKLIYLYKFIDLKPLVEIKYFKKELDKDSGKYNTITGIITKIDKLNKCLIIDKEIEILFEDIIELNSNIFTRDYNL